MHDLFDWNRLDAAAFRVSIRRSVRRYGWIFAVVGALLLAFGLAGDHSPMAAIRVLLASAGVWNLCRRSVTGVIVDGIGMIISGSFVGLAWLWIENARASSVARWIAAGAIQVVWGIRRLAFYATARHAANDPEAIARL